MRELRRKYVEVARGVVLRMDDEASSARHVKGDHIEEWTHEVIIDSCSG